ncbi:MAG: alpha/beta hydrolase [Flavobacteriales bacterium]|nr:alpha/beta hydrolase [Flavobacteriales bacterium]
MTRIFLLVLAMVSAYANAQDFYFIDVRRDYFHARELCTADDLTFGQYRPSSLVDSSMALLQSDLSIVELINRKDLLDHLAGKRVLILIHGMAKDWGQANKDLCNIYWNLGKHNIQQYDAVVGVTWPGDDYLGISPYVTANRNALKTARRIGPVLEELSSRCQSVDLITHSMGSKVASKCLKSYDFHCRNAFFLAPSIFRGSLRPGGRWRRSLKSIDEQLLVFHSTGDWAFNWTRLQHMGMGYRGIAGRIARKNSKISQIDCSAYINQEVYKRIPRNAFTSRSNHSYYTECHEVFHYISCALKGTNSNASSAEP